MSNLLRTGQCTLGCGACCRSVSILVKAERMTQEYAQEAMLARTLLAHPVYHDSADGKLWAELHGLVVGKEGDESKIVIPSSVAEMRFRWTARGVMVDMPLECSMLTAEGLCSIWGQPGRPLTCALWPAVPEDIETLGGVCTYIFEGA